MISMRKGGMPIWKIVPVLLKSSIVRSRSGAPKSESALRTSSAFLRLGFTHTSRSFVARTCPYAASACAPTIRYSTLCALKMSNSSLKSGFTSEMLFPGKTKFGKCPYGFDSLLGRKAHPVGVRRLAPSISDYSHRFFFKRRSKHGLIISCALNCQTAAFWLLH